MPGFVDVAGMPEGIFRLEVKRNGGVVERICERNRIVVGYRDVAAAGLGGLPGAIVTQFGIGTGAAPAVFGNTGLTGAFLKGFDAVALGPSNAGQVVFSFSLASGEGNGIAIAEFGLLTAGGVLVARKTRVAAPIVKDATISLSGTWTIQYPGA